MKSIKTINVEGNEVQVDDEDLNFIITCFNLSMRGVYVYCKLKPKYRGMGMRSADLQKVLMLPEKTGRSIVVDHKDGNELNNQKYNLRICSQQNNARNRKVSINLYLAGDKTSKYKGVSWSKEKQAWQAYIRDDKYHMISLNSYSNEDAAANAYNHFANIFHGEFAKLNDVPPMNKKEWESFVLKKEKSSTFRGVSFVDGKWLAQIYHEGRNIRIANFDEEIEAALAYNRKATELKKERARLNKIDQTYGGV